MFMLASSLQARLLLRQAFLATFYKGSRQPGISKGIRGAKTVNGLG